MYYSMYGEAPEIVVWEHQYSPNDATNAYNQCWPTTWCHPAMPRASASDHARWCLPYMPRGSAFNQCFPDWR
jgi:hypothetical protein